MKYLEELLEEITSGDLDPLRKSYRLHAEVLPELDRLRRKVIAQRALSVKEACDFGNGGDGLTYSSVAKSLGCSKPLVQQMVALARSLQEEMLASRNGQKISD